MLKIKSVEENSLGEELGLKAGDAVIKFNEEPDIDILDYIYYDASESFTMSVKKSGGIIEEFDIEKYPEEEIGLDFDKSAEIKSAKCINKCLFCFVDQLPKKMRYTLYIKDDDYRLSFVTGNYVTLTNIKEKDILRIIDKKLSPLYISVHATDSKARCRLLGNKFAGNILEIIGRLAAAGITMHCQVVLCPGFNDGEILRKTIKELYKFYPAVKTLAVVPVGLTRHRERLFDINPVTKEIAAQTIKLCGYNDNNFVFCSDEMYLRAETELPSFESYGEFEQIENGVGLIRKFEKEFFDAFDNNIKPKKRDIIIVTGQSALEFIGSLVKEFSKKYNFNTIETIGIQNYFLGENITVSGLITGGDIINQLGKKAAGKEVILPKCMLKEFENIFLDGMDINSLENQLGADVKVCEMQGYNFFDALIGEI